MIALPAVLYLTSAAATLTAIRLARRDPRHRPIAALFTLGLAADLAVVALEPGAGWVHPLTGRARAAFHVAELLHALYPLAVLGAAVAVLLDREGRGVWGRRLLLALGVVAAAYGAGLVLGYTPLALWGDRLWRVYGGAEAVVVAGLVAVVAAWGRARRRTAGGLRVESAGEVVVLWSAAVEALNLLGPYALGRARWFPLATGAYVLLYVVAVVVQVREGGGRWRQES